MHWVYILECDGGRLYVGETTRLFRRFWEHNGGKGGVNTTMYRPRNIVAVYKVQTIGKFTAYDYDVNWTITEDPTNSLNKYRAVKLFNFDKDEEGRYDHLDVENAVTECLGMHRSDKWNDIKGGKYIRQDILYKRPDNKDILRLPLCDCGYPCDIRKNKEKNCLFFRCARKNMWDDFKDMFDVRDEPCKFYKEYTHDLPLRRAEEDRSLKYRRLLAKSSNWLRCAPEDDIDCVCCGEESYIGVNLEFKRAVCEDCFLNRNEEAESKCRPLAKKVILSMFADD